MIGTEWRYMYARKTMWEGKRKHRERAGADTDTGKGYGGRNDEGVAEGMGWRLRKCVFDR
jgi:hypothetical protein